MRRHDAPKRRFNDYHIALDFQAGAHNGTVYAHVEGADEAYGAQILRAMLGMDIGDPEGVRALLQGEIPDEVQGLGEDEAVEEITGADPSVGFESLLLELADDPRNEKVLRRQVVTNDEGEEYEIPSLTLWNANQTLHLVNDPEDYLVGVRITQARPTPKDVIAEIAQEESRIQFAEEQLRL